MSEIGLEYRKGAVILLLLVLFLSVNIIALFIYFSAGSEKIQAKQALKVLDNQVSLESAYINNLENNLENITEIIDSFYSGNSNHKSTNSNSHSISTYSLNIICGNGINEQGEECDDGNKDDYDGCTNLCDFDFSGLLHCGDNKTDSGEQCDLGKDNGKKCIPGYNTTCTYCSILCRNKTLTRFCGDNILDSEEECDDGNNLNWDGCSAYCTVEPECCGDSDCPDDKNSSGYCYNNDIYKNLTDYFCEYHNCLFNTTKIFVQDCNNESYSDNYCYDNNVYVNHTSGGCETGECILITNPEKVENCGNKVYMEGKYC